MSYGCFRPGDYLNLELHIQVDKSIPSQRSNLGEEEHSANRDGQHKL